LPAEPFVPLSKRKEKQTDLKDNPFRGLADVAVQSIQLQWGWAVLVIGIVLLVAAAAMKDTSKDFAL
jgi:hypothetical protein